VLCRQQKISTLRNLRTYGYPCGPPKPINFLIVKTVKGPSIGVRELITSVIDCRSTQYPTIVAFIEDNHCFASVSVYIYVYKYSPGIKTLGILPADLLVHFVSCQRAVLLPYHYALKHGIAVDY
jgi:hypothetical protein